MVKTLHPLGPLSPRLKLAPEARVGLERDVDLADQPCEDQSSTGLDVVADVAAATLEALRHPLDFPPLAQAVVPGDRLAIPVDEAVPSVVSVVRGAIAAAVEAGFATDDIDVLTRDDQLTEILAADLRGPSGEEIRIVRHDPQDAEQHCPIGQTEQGDWLRINRTLFDAEVVLPIGCARLSENLNNADESPRNEQPTEQGTSVFDCLFPRFSDAAASAGLRSPAARAKAKAQSIARRTADEAGRMLGVAMMIQVVPGGAGGVADVIAGEPRAVARRSGECCRRLWAYRVPQRASLVIATITGDRIEHRWENVARALAAAERVAVEGGAVAICSDLDTPLDQSLVELLEGGDWEDVERLAARDESSEGWTAWQLARALGRGPVYFLSQLEADVVEEIGLAPVADLDELERLASRHESCLVLDHSQHVVPTVAGES